MNHEEREGLDKVVDHLFRKISGQIIATLTGIFGPENLDLAETVVQDTFLNALDNWPIAGIPENPEGWLIRVARNRAIDIIRREKRLYNLEETHISGSLARHLDSESPEFEIHFIADDQLRLMFICCHPCLSRTSQITLTLRMVSGFSVGEIAKAFLKNESSVKRSLSRAKRKIRENRLTFTLPPSRQIQKRLEVVLIIIYLIFNEGYSATSGDLLIRRDFCDEAIRLARLFFQKSYLELKMPTIKAFLALMLFHSARMPARIDANQNLILLKDQDRSLWDRHKIAEGLQLLAESATGTEVSVYHFQAHIAACRRSNHKLKALQYYNKALCQAKTSAEKRFLLKQIEECS